MKRNNITKVLVFLALCVLLFFAVKQAQIGQIHKNNLKIGGILEEVKSKYPDVKETDLIRLINSKDVEIDLSQYGIEKNDSIVDNSRENLRLVAYFCIFALTFVLIFTFISILEKRKLTRSINRLFDEIEKISQGDYDIRTINEEGEFAILQSYIHKISTALKEESVNSIEKKEVFKNNLEDISHQIKTPLAAINLLLENLADPDLDEEVKKEIVDDLRNETDAITNLVLILLKISSLEAKSRPFFRKEIYIKDLVNNAIDILKPDISKRGIDFDFEFSNEGFYGDFNWEKEVFINLIKNAIEHGEDNIVQIKARDTNTYLEVKVINKGGNFSKEDQLRIFDRFYRLSTSSNNFGIGLNLCKLIVEEDNGKIKMENVDGYTSLVIKYYKNVNF